MKFNHFCTVLINLTLLLTSQLCFSFSASDELKQHIINGSNANQSAYPFVTALIFSSAGDSEKLSPFCGASFIGGRYVLTASHCVEGLTAAELDVVISEHDLQDRTNELRYKVSQIYLNEIYDTVTINNDIAILELKNEVVNVAPVKLISPQMEAQLNTGDLLTVMGWGNMAVGDSVFPTILQEAELPLYDQEKCNQAYGGSITDNMICAGFDAGGKDSCQGDSGGPLVVKQNNEWYQVGVVSFGYECGQEGVPGVYARVSKFIAWIDRKKAGVSYQQTTHQGYVEQHFDGVVTINLKNLSTTAYRVTALDFTDLLNTSQPTVISNECNTQEIAQGESCELRLKVTSNGVGEGSFTMNATTNHPDNNLITQFVLFEALEPTSLDMKSLVDNNYNGIEWYSGGDALWEAQTEQILEGDNAIVSGDITHDQVSVLLAVIKSSKATNLSFHYLVHAETGYDGLQVVNNGELIFSATGITQTDFAKRTITLQENVDRIAFIFEKDEDDVLPVGFNKAYIDLVNVTVTNSAPVVALTQTSFEVEVSQSLVLDASNTTDEDGDSISYKWELVSATLDASLNESTVSTATFSAGNTQGDVTFKVTATDQYGASSSETGVVKIIASSTVTNTANTTNTTNTSGSSASEAKSSGGVSYLLLFMLVFVYLKNIQTLQKRRTP
mgnify:CR=1 FL=1